MWLVSVEELHFGEPVEIVGQGSFGVVLLAEYRGTKVAIKRALPPSTKGGSKKSSNGLLHGGSSNTDSKEHELELRDGSEDIEAQTGMRGNKQRDSVSKSAGSHVISKTTGESQASEFSFLGMDEFEASQGQWALCCPAVLGLTSEHARIKSSILAGADSTHKSSYLTFKAIFCPCCDKQSRQKEEFLEEMRLLSR